MDVACSLAMIGREMFEDLRVFTFSNALVEVPGRRGFALRDAITGSQPHGGTELGKAVGSLPARDRLIVITDEQSHDPVPQMKGYMINVASNKNGVGYGTWLHIDGWSDKVLDYIVKYEATGRMTPDELRAHLRLAERRTGDGRADDARPSSSLGCRRSDEARGEVEDHEGR